MIPALDSDPESDYSDLDPGKSGIVTPLPRPSVRLCAHAKLSRYLGNNRRRKRGARFLKYLGSLRCCARGPTRIVLG